MSKRDSEFNIVGPLMLVLALLIYAFSHGFWTGLNLLGDIINIFGTVFVWLIKLIWNIPVMGQMIIKRCVTTIIIIVFFGTSLSNSENKILTLIIGGGVSLVCLVLSWIGLF